ncbi:Glycoside hydrolase superfamily [Acididesulfobacillus acetoxydans]|uniref:Glycoside hydrolase superfamily n=1 Tax=Acididesulfobacillus acetoxydans TaxID=1561005 RepID=A0A8S0XC38_9FIRM|nr:DUF1906 domain-containing protein [Acididesulfobacillus acetoxydans]CAA7601966.1 Glycoside hydrolase superfamily [Acididesulfobacillus acetoxydans]CEJ08190.1 Domain of unknown function (DUF1906) [Acididesulfobacillus acetoxydans]
MSDAALTWQKRKSLTLGRRLAIFFVLLFVAGLIYSLEAGFPGQLIHFLNERKFPYDDILIEGVPGISERQLLAQDEEERKIASRAIFLPILGPAGLGWIFNPSVPKHPKQDVPPKPLMANSTTISKQTSCINGLDADSDLSLEVSSIRTSTPYRFVGRYLGGPCYPGKPLSESEASTLSNAGFWIVSIYSGANHTDTIHGGTQSYAQGQKDGQQAVLLAGEVRQPVKSAIYLDLEAQQLNQNHYVSYVKGWVRAVRADGYIPGVYSSVAQLQTILRESWAGTSILYWDAHWLYSGVQTPAPCPSKDLSYAQVWQYAKHTLVCKKTVDIDTAKNTDGMWRISK